MRSGLARAAHHPPRGRKLVAVPLRTRRGFRGAARVRRAALSCRRVRRLHPPRGAALAGQQRCGLAGFLRRAGSRGPVPGAGAQPWRRSGLPRVACAAGPGAQRDQHRALGLFQ
ncbi:hypothetical protein G6F23_014364 [Rhizopus arrhizus]|nr:hypothetical protein G6F23_014364 [Rhizopus arrhizus]